MNIKKINDILIHRTEKHLIEQLVSIANAIDTMATDTTSLADATTNEKLSQHKEAVGKRMKQAITIEHLHGSL